MTTSKSPLPFKACILVPAYDAARSIEAVIAELRREVPEATVIVVIDDGSRDGTAEAAARAGARVISHGENRGKGAALVTGLRVAESLGFACALTVDADGQHPGASARAVLMASDDPSALVLGVRDLAGAGAPKKNQMSNGISNFFLSSFTKQRLRDTQCGLRRYPVRETLALSGQARGYAYEAEILLRAVQARVPIVQIVVPVFYPPEGERVTHFDAVKDPARIIYAVVKTLFELRMRG